MNGSRGPESDNHEQERRRVPAWLRMAGLLTSDVAIGVLLAALVIATLLFSSGASKFVYIDF